MAALLGRLDQFEPEQEEWPQYVERLVQFFEANDITGDNKAAKCCAIYLSFSYWASALQVVAKPHSPHEAHRQDIQRACCCPHRTLQSAAIRGHATVLFQFPVEERGRICGRVCRRTTLSGRILSFRNYLGQDAPGLTLMGH